MGHRTSAGRMVASSRSGFMLSPASGRFMAEIPLYLIAATFLAAPDYPRLAFWRVRLLFQAPTKLPAEAPPGSQAAPARPAASNKGSSRSSTDRRTGSDHTSTRNLPSARERERSRHSRSDRR